MMPDYAWECNINELAVIWKCDDMVMLSYLRIHMYFYLFSQSLILKKQYQIYTPFTEKALKIFGSNIKNKY